MFLENWEREKHVFVSGNWEEKTSRVDLFVTDTEAVD